MRHITRLVVGAVFATFLVAAAAPQSEARLIEPNEMNGFAARNPLGLAWDRAIRNDFEWLMASSKISTACRTGRAQFEAYVAMVDCAIDGGGRTARNDKASRVAAFSGVGGGSARSGVALDNPAPGAGDLTVVPLPAAGWLLFTALGGLAYLRHRA